MTWQDGRVTVALTVPGAAFVDTIARVARAASRDETRPHLTGELVRLASGIDTRPRRAQLVGSSSLLAQPRTGLVRPRLLRHGER